MSVQLSAGFHSDEPLNRSNSVIHPCAINTQHQMYVQIQNYISWSSNTVIHISSSIYVVNIIIHNHNMFMPASLQSAPLQQTSLLFIYMISVHSSYILTSVQLHCPCLVVCTLYKPLLCSAPSVTHIIL